MESNEETIQSVEEQRVVETPEVPKPGGGSKAVLYVLVVVTVLLIAQMMTTALVFMEVSENAPESGKDGPSGSFASVLRDFPSMADIEFGAFSFDPESSKMRVRLLNGSMVLTYGFPTGGQMMIPPDFGFQLPEIQFWDEMPEEYLNEGDSLRIEGLTENSDYRIELIWAPSWELIDAVDMSVPVPDEMAPWGSFWGVDVTSSTEATATFFTYVTFPGLLSFPSIELWDQNDYAVYAYQGSTQLLRIQGSLNVDITFIDYNMDGSIDSGDQLMMSGLDPETLYMILMIWIPKNEILDWEVFSTSDGGAVIPTGTWGAKTPISNTAYNVDFGKIIPEPKPVDLELILIRNGTDEGKYSFSSNDDGVLTFASGVNLGTLTYSDLADNQKVNIGDQVKLTGLSPNSDYTLKMIWGPTGDQITTTSFATPG